MHTPFKIGVPPPPFPLPRGLFPALRAVTIVGPRPHTINIKWAQLHTDLFTPKDYINCRTLGQVCRKVQKPTIHTYSILHSSSPEVIQKFVHLYSVQCTHSAVFIVTT